MRGTSTLIENASATIFPKRKVGIIGRNGCGKSTLFSALLDTIQVEKGSINYPKGMKISSLSQQITELDISALEFVKRGDKDLIALLEKRDKVYAENDGAKIALIEDELGLIGAWTIKSRICALLHGLGFSEDEFDKKVSDFSGGWRMRLNLARALIYKSDLLLLDEPTNHLDLDTVLFLEQYLKNYEGTLLCISHDRDFLDSFCTDILHFEQKKLVMYTGNYSDYERLRAERIKQEKATRKKEEQMIAHMQAFVDRFRSKASKSKQAQSKLKAINKMELTAVTVEDSPFSFSFAKPERTVQVIANFNHVDAGYDGNIILKDINFELLAGDKIGLLGKNGQGKSTFIKTLAQELKCINGSCTLGANIKIGYFAQHEIESLSYDESALWYMQRLDPNAKEKDLRSFLGSFAFSGDKALLNVNQMSGGERARLALCLIAYQKPNLLLLDEPTNHLDLEMREALSFALSTFEGAMVLVSHDRHLLEAISDKLVMIDNHKVSEFNGDLDDYKEFLNQKNKEYRESLKDEVRASPSQNLYKTKEDKKAQAQFRQALRPYKLVIEKIESQMDKLKKELIHIDESMANEDFYNKDAKEIEKTIKDRATIQANLDELEMDWLLKQEELESIIERGSI